MPEPGYDPNAISSFYNPSSTPTPKLRPSGLGSRPSTADNKGSSAVFSAPKPTYSSNDNNDNSDKRLTPVTALYSSTAASLADAGARLAKNSETRITPMNLYDQKNMQEMQTELEDYLRGVDIEDAIAADMARMAVPEVYTGEIDDVEVKAGDTLTAIAKDKDVSLKELIDANPQIDDPDLIFPGQKINIPSTEETPVVDQEDTSTLKGGQVGLMSKPQAEPTVEDTKMAEATLQKNPTDDSLENALAIAANIKNAKPEDILNKVIKPMAYHESDSTMDPTLAQYGGGPARGVMQYEPNSFVTAVKRAKNHYKDKLKQDVPEWISNIDLSGDIQSEIVSLSADQQMAIAVYDMLEHPKADIGKVISGKQNIEDFWAEHWWAGPKKEKKKRIRAFRVSQSKLNKSPSDNITAFEFP
jgi:spore coat assembly protein SafA